VRGALRPERVPCAPTSRGRLGPVRLKSARGPRATYSTVMLCAWPDVFFRRGHVFCSLGIHCPCLSCWALRVSSSDKESPSGDRRVVCTLAICGAFGVDDSGGTPGAAQICTEVLCSAQTRCAVFFHAGQYSTAQHSTCRQVAWFSSVPASGSTAAEPSCRRSRSPCAAAQPRTQRISGPGGGAGKRRGPWGRRDGQLFVGGLHVAGASERVPQGVADEIVTDGCSRQQTPHVLQPGRVAVSGPMGQRHGSSSKSTAAASASRSHPQVPS
jgi:hypothetical protein